MLKIEFHDREKEISEIMHVLNAQPSLITFVYGPINSGKTELFNHLVKILPKDFRVFYINLRGIYVEKSEDFLKVLFEVKGRNVKDCIKYALDILPNEVVTPKGKIPIPRSLLRQIFKEKELENVFVYLESFLTEISKKKIPVLVLDELQKIGDIKINGMLIYELFNLFVRLTKELHCCHVFAITSDSLFIERVYSEAMLHGRCRYLLVDDFDYDATKSFLKKYGFNDEEVEIVWKYFGGKPVYLVEAVRNKHRLGKFCEEMLKIRMNQIRFLLSDVKRRGEIRVEEVLKALEPFKDSEAIEFFELNDIVEFLIRNNIFFLDPVNGTLKLQSKLDLVAVRKIL